MTMNGAVLPVLAMYIVAAEEQVSHCILYYFVVEKLERAISKELPNDLTWLSDVAIKCP